MSAYTNAQASFFNYTYPRQRAMEGDAVRKRVKRKRMALAETIREGKDLLDILAALGKYEQARIDGQRASKMHSEATTIMYQACTNMMLHMVDGGFAKINQNMELTLHGFFFAKLEELPDGSYRVDCGFSSTEWPFWVYSTADNPRRAMETFLERELVHLGYALWNICQWIKGRG